MGRLSPFLLAFAFISVLAYAGRARCETPTPAIASATRNVPQVATTSAAASLHAPVMATPVMNGASVTPAETESTTPGGTNVAVFPRELWDGRDLVPVGPPRTADRRWWLVNGIAASTMALDLVEVNRCVAAQACNLRRGRGNYMALNLVTVATGMYSTYRLKRSGNKAWFVPGIAQMLVQSTVALRAGTMSR